MRYPEKRVPWLYRSIRWSFDSALKLFYNTVELHAEENVPPPGNCTILCANHGNSLTDAIVVVSQTPRMVRLTAKDSLWRVPFFSFFVKGVGTVPIQRRDEHGAGADNTASMSKLYEALEAGACICLFPEGVSRYQSGLAPLKSGVGRIALELLRRNLKAGREDFTISIVPCGITYLHREKFRSDLGVSFAKPQVLRASEYQNMVADGGEPGAAKRIMDGVAKGLREFAISAPDWDVMRAAHVARRLYAPLGTRISLHQHVALTQRFVKVFSLIPEGELEGQRLKRRKSEPDLPAAEFEATLEEVEGVDALRRDLLSYLYGLDDLSLPDEYILKPQPPAHGLLVDALLRFVWGMLLLSLAAPGALVMLPIFAAGKYLEWHLQVTNEGPILVRNMDEVAQYKLAVISVMGPGLIGVGAWLLRRFVGVPWTEGLPLAMVWLWMTVRWLEDGMSSANACVNKLRLLVRKREANALREQRAALVPRVQAVAAKYQLPGREQLLQEAPKEYRNRNNLVSYFSLRRRRKKEWGEILHLGGKQDFPYPLEVLKRQEHIRERRKKEKGNKKAA